MMKIIFSKDERLMADVGWYLTLHGRSTSALHAPQAGKRAHHRRVKRPPSVQDIIAYSRVELSMDGRGGSRKARSLR